jgi:hypothetical protein
MHVLANYYDYAGFKYQIAETMTGTWAYPQPGLDQHSAANKEKHRRAAVNCWKADNPAWHPGKLPTQAELDAQRIRRLEIDLALARQRANEQSWRDNPDRSGGQFTEQEIEEARRGGHGW